MSAQYRPYRDEDNGGDSEPMTWPEHEPSGAVQIYEKTTEDIRVVSHRNLVIGGLGIALLGLLAGLLAGYFAHTQHAECVRGKSVAIHAVYDADPSVRARLLALVAADGINRTAGQLLEVRTDAELVDLLRQQWQEQGLEAVEQESYEALLSFPDASRPNRLRRFDNASDAAGTTVDLFTDDHRPYVAYCTADAPVRGPVVYAGRLQPSDVDWLHSSNVTLAESVLLVRLGAEPLFRQLALAQRVGARAVLLYPDPREFRPLPHGYPPEGEQASSAWWWLPPDGSHSASPLGPLLGDPQTPGYPATASAHRIPRDQLFLPSVPAQTISATVAESLLRRLEGPAVSAEMQGSLGGGSVPQSAGPGPVEAELQLHNSLRNHSLHDLVGYVRGRVEPDRYVLVGAGRDAWGDSDVGSMALLLELSAAFGQLLKQGWRPRRTVVFCSWAAEEFQSVGVVEWLEEHLKLLHGRAVAYIDLGQPVLGSTSLSVAASPLLYHAVFNATRQVPAGGGRSVYEQWASTFPKHRNVSRLLFPPATGATPVAASLPLEEGEEGDAFLLEPQGLLASYMHAASLPVRPAVRAMDAEGSYAAFFSRAGVPVVQMSYVDDILQKMSRVAFPRKHTQYDRFSLFRDHVDPELRAHTAVAAVAGELVRALADSLFLPFNLFDYAQLLKDLCLSLHLHAHGLDLGPLDEAVQNFSAAAFAFHLRQDSLDTSDPMAIRMVNDQLLLLERVFLDPRGLPQNPYKKHLVLSPPELPTYVDEMFPGIMDEFTRLVDELGAPADPGPHLIVLRQHYSLLVQVIQQAADTLAAVVPPAAATAA